MTDGRAPERTLGSRIDPRNRVALRDLPAREIAGLAQPIAPLKGRYMRPRAIEIGQVPLRILSPNPRRLGAFIANVGSTLEFPIELPRSGAGSTLALAKVLDSAGIAIPPLATSTFKSIYLVVDTALAWVTAAQPTIQLVVGRGPWGPASGATTGVGGNNGNSTKGAVANLGPAAATSLAVGLWPFSPADIADLQWHAPFVGLEFVFGSALTAGAARLFLELAGGASLQVGEEMAITANPGDRSNAWSITAQSAPTFLQDDGEVWAVAGPGGTVDCRIWEVWKDGPSPGW